jgi:hypothetical protein
MKNRVATLTAQMVGRTPWSARDALVPLPSQRYHHHAERQQADGGVGRGPGVRLTRLRGCGFSTLLGWAFRPRNFMKKGGAGAFACQNLDPSLSGWQAEAPAPPTWFFDSVGMGVPPAKLHEKPSAARFGGADQGVPYQAGFSPLSIRAQLGPLWWGELQPA